jgi:hypothetical protein
VAAHNTEVWTFALSATSILKSLGGLPFFTNLAKGKIMPDTGTIIPGDEKCFY